MHNPPVIHRQQDYKETAVCASGALACVKKEHDPASFFFMERKRRRR